MMLVADMKAPDRQEGHDQIGRAPQPASNGGGRVELSGVGKTYAGLRVLQPLDLAIESGEFLTILGPSGSGKSTVLRIIGGFIEPTEGRLTLDGHDITKVPVTERPFNTVFQDYALFPHMTVEQNVGYGLMVRGLPRAAIAKRVSEVLSVVSLGDRAKSLPRQLSGGQRQRVALARAIICEPRVILLDEPLSALDAELRHQMQIFLKDLQRRIRTTFVFVTHDQSEALTMSDRIVVMNKGQIEQCGRPRDLYYQPQTEFVAGFFGDNNVINGKIARIAGGAAWVDTAIGQINVVTGLLLAEGQRVTLAIRPEHMALAAPGNGGIAGHIQDMEFVGALTHVRVQVGQHLLRVKVPTPSLPEFLAVGEPTQLNWRTEDVHLVPPARTATPV